jgi:hypothetical protein
LSHHHREDGHKCQECHTLGHFSLLSLILILGFEKLAFFLEQH